MQACGRCPTAQRRPSVSHVGLRPDDILGSIEAKVTSDRVTQMEGNHMEEN